MLKPKNFRSWSKYIRVLSDVPVSENWYKTVPKLYQNFSMKSLSVKQKVRNLSETKISQRSLKNSGLLLLLFKSNNFSFLIYIIDTFVSREQNSHQWQCSIFATCLRLYHVTLSRFHFLANSMDLEDTLNGRFNGL